MPYIKTLLLAVFFNIAISNSILAGDTNIVLAATGTITLDQAIDKVKKGSKGKVLDAETLQIDGQPVHVIKVLTTKGRVKKIRVQTTPN
ncbi:MAG: hypothetical protein KUG50_02130 [Cycloclasticus sp.]|nr:hypothetical protein [Cycloclasticus sp.]